MISHANKERLKVFSYQELVALIVSFIVVLILLFPKNMIEKQVLRETSNYDLTATYLQNMLRIDPHNETLVFALIQSVYKSGNIDLALRLIDTLEDSRNSILQYEVEGLNYLLLKEQYSRGNKKDKTQLYAKLHMMFLKIIQMMPYTKDNLNHWYHEAKWLKLYDHAFDLAKKALKKEPSSLFWLQEIYTLSYQTGDKSLLDATLKKLVALDGKHKKKWIEAYAQYALDTRQYKKASQEYLWLAEHSTKEDVKKTYLLKSIHALQYGKLYKEASQLAQLYQDQYLNDTAMMNQFLKIYLSSNDLKAASKLSDILLQKSEKNEK